MRKRRISFDSYNWWVHDFKNLYYTVYYGDSLKKGNCSEGHSAFGCQNCKTLAERNQCCQEYASYFIINME